MGYMRRHAIVVSSWNEEQLAAAHAKALEVFGAVEMAQLVTPIAPAKANGGGSFLVAPDGSKEGWATSDQGDSARTLLIAWLDQQRYSDRSTSLDWVEVQFGDDERETVVITDSDAWTRETDSKDA